MNLSRSVSFCPQQNFHILSRVKNFKIINGDDQNDHNLSPTKLILIFYLGMYLRSHIPKSSSLRLLANLKVSPVQVTLVKKCGSQPDDHRPHPSLPPSPTWEMDDLVAISSLSDSSRDIKQSLTGAIFGPVRDQISINQQWLLPVVETWPVIQWEFWKVKSNNTQLKDLSLELLLKKENYKISPLILS